MGGIFGNALYRANFHTLGCIKMTHAFGAQVGINFVYLYARVNGIIGAFGLTHVAVDAFFGDDQSQGQLPVNPNCFFNALSISVPTN